MDVAEDKEGATDSEAPAIAEPGQPTTDDTTTPTDTLVTEVDSAATAGISPLTTGNETLTDADPDSATVQSLVASKTEILPVPNEIPLEIKESIKSDSQTTAVVSKSGEISKIPTQKIDGEAIALDAPSSTQADPSIGSESSRIEKKSGIIPQPSGELGMISVSKQTVESITDGQASKLIAPSDLQVDSKKSLSTLGQSMSTISSREPSEGKNKRTLAVADRIQIQTAVDRIMSEAEELALHPSRSQITMSELGLAMKPTASKKGEIESKMESFQRLKTIYQREESEYASSVPSAMELYAAGIEEGLTLNDFAWPKFAPEERDQVYENLLAMTVVNPNLCVMQDEHVLLRKNHYDSMPNKIKLIIGGRAGNEPLFSGYVGTGMATAAVIGDRKNAPKSLAVYKTIKELALHHDAGILIIIPNEIDYRIVFGLAMERARGEGHLVDMIVISDDCCDQVETKTGRRCLAGYVLALKVAGAMSEDERTLKEVYMTVRSLLIVTISAHVNDSNIFVATGIKDGGYEVKCDCVKKEDDCSLQTSSGCATKTHNKLRNIVEIMLEYATGYKKYFSLPLKPFAETVLLINSYSEDQMFMYSVVAEVLRQIYCQDVAVTRIYTGTFVSSRRGFSISLLKIVDDTVLQWLDYPTNAYVWPPMRLPGTTPVVTKSICKLPVIENKRQFGPKFSCRQQTLIPFILSTILEDLLLTEAILNKLDPKKIFGTCILNGCKAILVANKGQKLDYSRPYNLFHQIAMIIEESCGGAVGSLVALFFGAMANEFLKFAESREVDVSMFGMALISASNAFCVYGRVDPEKEAFIGDVCIPVGNYLIETASLPTFDGVLEKIFDETKLNIAKARNKPFGLHYKGKEECSSIAFLFVVRTVLRVRKKIVF